MRDENAEVALQRLQDRALAHLQAAERLLEELTRDAEHPKYGEGSCAYTCLEFSLLDAVAMLLPDEDEPGSRLRIVGGTEVAP